MDNILVRKLDLDRAETWQYRGQLLARGDQFALIEANFNRDDTPFHGVLLRRGDPFVEIFYADRWYNVFEVHDRDDGRVKCWYCNVTLPAELGEGEIRYVDLALDLLVFPDGRQLVLDEDEFEALNPPPGLRTAALAALDALKQLVRPQDGFKLR